MSTTPTISVRSADSNDLNNLLKLQADTMPWTHDSPNPLTWDNLSTYVLTTDNEIISSVMAGMDAEASNIFLYGLMTHPKHQRNGYAQCLMNALLNNVNSSNLPVYLCVSGTNEPAQNLYLKLGFEFTGEVRNDNELVMIYKPPST